MNAIAEVDGLRVQYNRASGIGRKPAELLSVGVERGCVRTAEGAIMLRSIRTSD